MTTAEQHASSTEKPGKTMHTWFSILCVYGYKRRYRYFQTEIKANINIQYKEIDLKGHHTFSFLSAFYNEHSLLMSCRNIRVLTLLTAVILGSGTIGDFILHWVSYFLISLRQV